MAAMIGYERWTRVRALGRGASGAEVLLAADDRSGELFAVKSARASGAAALRREHAIMSGLRSPRVVSCIGGRAGRDGSYHLFLEFAPGGSLADEIAKSGGLQERAVRAYAADVAAGLAYLHGTGLVHGDVKARNIVIGADGRAKLADFGCSRMVGAGSIIGGTPVFMAPEVARGEEQGPSADVWALGCTVIEMATGRAPWSGMDGDGLAAMHRIGYTDAVPEVPHWLSAEAKDFLGMCLIRRASDRCTAAHLLEHPFLASAAGCDAKLDDVKGKWVSPKSTLDAAFWESESDSEDAGDELSVPHSTAERIMALACPASALPDWDSDEGWIDVLSASASTEEASDSDSDADADAVAVPLEKTTELDDAITSEEEPRGAESGVLGIAAGYSSTHGSTVVNAGEADGVSVGAHHRHQPLECLACRELPCTATSSTLLQFRNSIINTIDFVPAQNHTTLLLCFSAARSSSTCLRPPLRHDGLANSVSRRKVRLA